MGRALEWRSKSESQSTGDCFIIRVFQIEGAGILGFPDDFVGVFWVRAFEGEHHEGGVEGEGENISSVHSQSRPEKSQLALFPTGVPSRVWQTIKPNGRLWNSQGHVRSDPSLALPMNQTHMALHTRNGWRQEY